MKKKAIVSIFLVAILSLTIILPSFAIPNGNIIVKVNGKTLDLSTAKPFMDSGSKVYVPVRFIAEALGAKVDWVKDTNTAVINNGTNEIKINLSNKSILVNEKPANINNGVKFAGNRTYVTLQFLSDLFKVIVDWEEETWIARITNEPERNEIFTSQAELTGEDKALSDKLYNYLDSIEKYYNFHGIMLVAKGGKILVDKAYGMANYEQNIKNKVQTVYPIASMTKQFTATAIMQLQEKGLLSVNDKLSKYIPDFKRGDEITLHHLLTHTSGVMGSLEELIKKYDVNSIVELAKSKNLEFNPGEDCNYSNMGFALLGYIIEKVSGMSYDQYLKKNIFEPLNMKSSNVNYVNGEKNYQSTGYYGFLDIYPSREERIIKPAYSGGSICSTIEDLYLWDRALYTEKILSKKSLDTMFTKYSTWNDNEDFGYGWDVVNGEYGKVVTHKGNFYGFVSNIVRYIDKDIVIIKLVNNYPKKYNDKNVEESLEDIVFGKDCEIPEKGYKIIDGINPKIYDDYIGIYKTDEGKIIRLDKQLDGLYFNGLTFVEGQDGQLYPLSETEYILKEGSGEVTFKKDASGKITGLVYKGRKIEFEAKKLTSGPTVKLKAVKVDTKLYDNYTGEYYVKDTDSTFKIFKADNKLYYQELSALRTEIFALSPVNFFNLKNLQITFVKNSNEKVIGASLEINGLKYDAKKTR